MTAHRPQGRDLFEGDDGRLWLVVRHDDRDGRGYALLAVTDVKPVGVFTHKYKAVAAIPGYDLDHWEPER